MAAGDSSSSWWSSWLNSAKETSIAALTATKRDLSEFVTVLKEDTEAAVTGATTSIKGLLNGGEDEEEGGGSKIDLDSTPSTVAIATSRYEAQLNKIERTSLTYTQSPGDKFTQWVESFVVQDQTETISSLLLSKPHLQEMHTHLVPSVVSYNDFWSRYFYHVHCLKKEEEKRASFVARATGTSPTEELPWDDDDTDVTEGNPVLNPINEVVEPQVMERNHSLPAEIEKQPSIPGGTESAVNPPAEVPRGTESAVNPPAEVPGRMEPMMTQAAEAPTGTEMMKTPPEISRVTVEVMEVPVKIPRGRVEVMESPAEIPREVVKVMERPAEIPRGTEEMVKISTKIPGGLEVEQESGADVPIGQTTHIKPCSPQSIPADSCVEELPIATVKVLPGKSPADKICSPDKMGQSPLISPPHSESTDSFVCIPGDQSPTPLGQLPVNQSWQTISTNVSEGWEVLQGSTHASSSDLVSVQGSETGRFGECAREKLGSSTSEEDQGLQIAQLVKEIEQECDLTPPGDDDGNLGNDWEDWDD